MPFPWSKRGAEGRRKGSPTTYRNYERADQNVGSASSTISRIAIILDNFGHSTDVINYGEVSGEKPALLLIHGQMSIWEDYALVLPELSKNWHIYAIDVYGHGESSHDEPEMLRMVAAMEMIGA